MQSSLGPAWVGGAAIGVFPNGDPPTPGNALGEGAAPKDGAGAAPFTGGNAGSLAAPAFPGSGAGKELCAETWPAWNVTTATASGTIRGGS